MTRAYFTFGRFQPPTIGHKRVFDSLYESSLKDKADHFVFVSHTMDSLRNPISPGKKILFLENMFPHLNVVSLDYGIINPYQAARIISENGYKNVKMFVGGDRATEFQTGIRAYINHPDPTKSYAFENFSVVDAGSRLDEDDTISKASGTKARELALSGQLDLFAEMIPSDDDNIIESIYYAIREGSQLSEAEIIRNTLI